MTKHKPETAVRATGGAADEAFGFRPLYRQIKDMFVRRLVEGVWQPGDALPSEGELARDLGVSQGTVRKALDEMAVEKLVVRRQGRGTFVAEHDEKRILFQFFKLVPDKGAVRFPDSRVLEADVGRAMADERERLRLGSGEAVIRIRRVRALDGEPLIVETVVLPEKLFPDLIEQEIPNNLYSIFSSRYGITVARAREMLKAVLLGPEDAALLARPAGTPALEIDRAGLSLEGTPVEWRRSLCLTEHTHYLADLR